MIAHCDGCKYEIEEAYDFQQEGLHLVDAWYTYLGEKGKHFFIMMVDDDGKVMVW